MGGWARLSTDPQQSPTNDSHRTPGAVKPQPGNSKSEIRNPKQIRMTKILNKANKIEQKKQNSDG
jgi:hypothetical protein